MTRQHLFAAFFFAAFVFLLYQFYQVFSVFLVPLTWAALLALMFYPLNVWVTRQLRGRNSLAAFLFTTLVILVVIIPTVLISILLASQSVALFERARAFVTGGELVALLERLKASTPARLWSVLTPIVTDWHLDLPGVGLTAANTVSGFLMSQATGILRNLATFVLNFLLTTFALFFFFRDGERIVGAVRRVLPMESEHKDVILQRFYDTVAAVVQGTLVTAAAQGTLAGLGYLTFGVPFFVFFGCVTGLVSLLPGGPLIVWGPLVIYLGTTGHMGRAILLTLWSVLVVGTVDNFIRPLLIGGRAEIPTLLLFFGMLGGMQAYGFLGIFLAPALIAVLFAFIAIYEEQYGAPRA